MRERDNMHPLFVKNFLIGFPRGGDTIRISYVATGQPLIIDH